MLISWVARLRANQDRVHILSKVIADLKEEIKYLTFELHHSREELRDLHSINSSAARYVRLYKPIRNEKWSNLDSRVRNLICEHAALLEELEEQELDPKQVIRKRCKLYLDDCKRYDSKWYRENYIPF